MSSRKDLKILIVGSDKVFAIENYYYKYMLEMGMNIKVFSAYTIFFDYYHKSIINKIIFKAGLSKIFNKINLQFKRAVKEYKPDVIWVFKGMEIFPASLQWARDQNIKLVNYNPDNPLLFSDKGSGNKFVTDSIKLYDLHLTYHLGVQKELLTRYDCKTEILPFAFDDNTQLYETCRQEKEIIKACFLGNPDSRRAAFIEALAEKGIVIDVYGNNWSGVLKNSNITIYPPAYGEDQWKILRRYRVQLNLMRIHNDNSHNMRSFEVPGIGGIMVAPDNAEHRMYFENGKEVFLYKDVNDCAEIIRRLLSLSETDASIIRDAARKRSIESGYSYEARAGQAKRFIEKLVRFD